MAFAQVAGHERAIEALRRSLDLGSLHPGYLFCGPEGVGKRTAALEFIRAYLCEAGGGDACGRCRSCRHVGGAAHPDFLLVEPETAHIRIDQVREGLIPFLALSPQWAGRKAALIDPADAMTGEAANALLKSLEEPPPRTILVLVTCQPALLLPTVVSRCQKIAFGPLPDAQVTEVLVRQGWDAEAARSAAPLAEGSPGRALAREGGSWRRRREELLALAEALARGDRGAAFAFVEELREGRDGREDALLGLEVLAGWLRRAIRAHLGDAGAAEGLPRFAAELGPDAAAGLLARALASHRALLGNVNPKLALAGFWLGGAGGPAARGERGGEEGGVPR